MNKIWERAVILHEGLIDNQKQKSDAKFRNKQCDTVDNTSIKMKRDEFLFILSIPFGYLYVNINYRKWFNMVIWELFVQFLFSRKNLFFGIFMKKKPETLVSCEVYIYERLFLTHSLIHWCLSIFCFVRGLIFMVIIMAVCLACTIFCVVVIWKIYNCDLE